MDWPFPFYGSRMSLSKKIRFEIFKRDGFKCTYCGQNPPQVVLEIDHIIPKSAGGKDEIVNLTTSCFDCNRGKSDRAIDFKIVRADVQKDVAIAKLKKEQLAQYYKFLEEIIAEQWKAVDIIERNFETLTNNKFTLSDCGRNNFFKLLKIYSLGSILQAMPITYSRFGDRFPNDGAFRYMCAILRNWKRDGTCPI